MKYKLIIFDWDGTLMDSIDKIVLCMQQAAKQESQLAPSVESVKNIIGLSLLKAMQTLFPTLTLSQQEDLVAAYRYQCKVYSHINTPLYKGIVEMLIDLKAKGYILAVATGKGRNGLNRMLAQSKTENMFSATICADEANSKPDPSMIIALLKQLNIDPRQALMVGDSSYDLDMANNAGIKSLAVSYGVHERSILAQSDPIAIIDCLATELQTYI